MRTIVRTVGLALLVMLVATPAATASTVSLRDSVVVYEGDAAADAVQLTRFVDTGNNIPYYLVSDSAGLTFGSGCFRVSATLGACRVTAGLKRYELRTGGGDDVVDIDADTAGGSADLGPGDDRFGGRAAGDAVQVATGTTSSRAARATTRSQATAAPTRSPARQATTRSTAAPATTSSSSAATPWPRAPARAPTTCTAAPAPTA